MWISSIKLKNFKSYAEAHFEFPEPTDKKNIVIIGAENSHGKTTLLEAIYLGLYAFKAMNHLGRAGLTSTSKRSYADYLNNALHKNATKKYNQYEMMISIELCKRNKNNKKEGIRIKRTWSFNSEGIFMPNNTQYTIYELDDNLPLDDEQAKRYELSHSIPIDYAPFFIFDGEKIVQTAETAGADGWLTNELRGLLGVTLLEALKNSLDGYLKTHVKAGSSSRAQEEMEKLETDMSVLRKDIEEYRTFIAVYSDKIKEIEKEEQQIFHYLGSANTDIQSKTALLKRQAELTQKNAELSNEIYEVFGELPLVLLPRQSIYDLLTKLKMEENRLTHEQMKDQTQDRVDFFWENFIKNVNVEKALGLMAETILSNPYMKKAVYESWDALHNPLPENCADKIQHNYLSRHAHNYIQTEFNQVLKLNVTQTLSQNIEQRSQNGREIEILTQQIEDMERTGKNRYIERLQELQQEKRGVENRLKEIEPKLLFCDKEYTEKKLKLDYKMREFSDKNPTQQKAHRSKRVMAMIDGLIQQLMKTKVDEISQLATLYNAKIFQDSHVHKIRIDEYGKIKLFAKNGQEVKIDNASGQVQVMVMSLIYAMAEVTDIQMPFVIDTPLARLDVKRRQGLLKHWTTLDQQVILLAQDAEINGAIAEELSPYVNKTYLVTAESIDNGVGKLSHVSADVYFKTSN